MEFVMADFVQVDIGDGTEVLFEAAESDLVSAHGAGAEVKRLGQETGRLEDIAAAAQQVCISMRQRMSPDELQLEIGVGLSGEVGWFFAKSSLDASLKVTATWKRTDTG
jgi:hypothetical protein